jgi:hypothetical protein
VFNSLCDVVPLQEELGALSNFTIEYYVRLEDTTNNQLIVTNRSSTGYNAGEFYLQWLASTNKFQWGIQGETPVTSTGTFAYDTWYHIALQRRGSDFELFVNGVRQGRITNYTDALDASSTLYFVLLGSTLPMKGHLDELRISNMARWTSDGFIPNFSNHSIPIGAWLDSGTLEPLSLNHWTTDSATLTMSSLDLIQGNVRYGTEVILDCDSGDYDYFGAWSLVYGGSDSRAYLFYTKSKTDLAGNHIVLKESDGLFYRKLTINDDLSISVGGELTVYARNISPTYGWNMAIDAIRLASNMFINIVIASDGTAPNDAHVIAIKTPYS